MHGRYIGSFGGCGFLFRGGLMGYNGGDDGSELGLGRVGWGIRE